MDWAAILLILARYQVQILAEYRLYIMHLAALHYMYRIRSEQTTIEHNFIKYSYS
jgi:hypothetical protein